jgi:hypothetical protein
MSIISTFIEDVSGIAASFAGNSKAAVSRIVDILSPPTG